MPDDAPEMVLVRRDDLRAAMDEVVVMNDPALARLLAAVNGEPATVETDLLREAMASALTSLNTGPLKDGYAAAVLAEALASVGPWTTQETP